MRKLTSIATLVLAATVGFAQTTPAPKSSTTTTTTTTTKTAKRSKKKSAKHSKPAPVVEQTPAPPPPPPTLAQQVPVPPNVTYRNGLLSIDAPNSTLGDILNGIRRATGAVIDGPSGVGDRMIVHLGPGQPRDVVAALLGGSRFDYIVMGTPQQPNGVNRLLLMARQGGAPPVQGTAPTTAQQQQPQRPPVAADSDEDQDQDQPADRDENSDAPPSQPMTAQPSQQQAPTPQLPPDQMAPQQGQQQQQQDQNQEANPNAPKTPEQLYKELQGLERQRQQQQQNQNQNNDQPPPQ